MSQINELLNKINSDQSIAYALIRIFLGSALFIRGVILASNPGAISKLVAEDNLHMWYSYITIGHLLGGLALALGLFSRLGALLQIPILIGAVFVVHNSGLMMGGQSLELAALVLFLLIIYFLFGAGSYSLNQRFKTPNL